MNAEELHQLFTDGKIASVFEFLRNPQEIYSEAYSWRNKNGETLLHRAALSGDVGIFQELLHYTPKEFINTPIYINGKAITPLCYAVQSGSKDMVNCLINNGANIHDLKNGLNGLKTYTTTREMHEYLDSPAFLTIVENSATKIQMIPNIADMPSSAKKNERPKDFSLLSPEQSTLKRNFSLPPTAAVAIQAIVANIPLLPRMPLATMDNRANPNRNKQDRENNNGQENQMNLVNQGNTGSPPRKKSSRDI